MSEIHIYGKIVDCCLYLQSWKKNYWPNGKIIGKIAFPRYTEGVKFSSQSRETDSKRKPYRGLGIR